jgi:hypothetical protein
MNTRTFVTLALVSFLTAPVFAGSAGNGSVYAGPAGHGPGRSIPRIGPAEAAELREHNRQVVDALSDCRKVAEEINERAATRYSKIVEPIGPKKDKFGDPMYTFYGPRAYVGTPSYVGPRYPASFERPGPALIPDQVDRSYLRGAAGAVYSPGMHTGGYLGVGASHSYFQSGMMMNPVSQAPSGTRAMENNH